MLVELLLGLDRIWRHEAVWIWKLKAMERLLELSGLFEDLWLGDRLFFQDGELFVPVGRPPRLMHVEVFILFVHFEKESFHFTTSILILFFVLTANAEVQGVFTFFLAWSFFEARSFSSESELNSLERVDVVALAAFLDYSLHVCSLAPDDSSSNLEFLLIIDLNIISASVLYSTIFLFVRLESFEVFRLRYNRLVIGLEAAV